VPEGLPPTESLRWRRSPHCSAGSCVELADLPDGRVAIRDSNEAKQSQILVFGSDEWAEFVAAIRAGDLG
jgi:Domain of unknown function (DUF397)